MELNEEILDKFVGCLLGLAAGDALGTSVEFQNPESFTPLTGIRGGGAFSLEPGEWTDDSSMALCMAESLLECGKQDLNDQMTRYLEWYENGHLSSNGECFDIGMTIRTALNKYMKTKDAYHSGPTGDRSAGNGSLMRLAPVPLWFFGHSLLEATEACAESSISTHGGDIAKDACRYYGALIIGAIKGESKETLLSKCYPSALWDSLSMHDTVRQVAEGSFKSKMPPDIRATGYVIESMEAALWAFHKTSGYAEGCLLCANLGHDADTVAAIYGQLAGAYYGAKGIPEDWSSVISLRDLIECYGEEIAHHVYNPSAGHSNSSRYVYMSQCLQIGEGLAKEILRKCKPGPNQYKTLDEFDADTEKFENDYKTAVGEKRQTIDELQTEEDGILSEFRRRLRRYRKDLAKFVNRNIILF